MTAKEKRKLHKAIAVVLKSNPGLTHEELICVCYRQGVIDGQNVMVKFIKKFFPEIADYILRAYVTKN
jgi:hypothetical protein